jgi:hypothetical protein
MDPLNAPPNLLFEIINTGSLYKLILTSPKESNLVPEDETSRQAS